METRYLAGHTGLVGSALLRGWAGRGDLRIVTATRDAVDLTDPRAVQRFLSRERPDTAIIAAGKVGGILANARESAEFIHQNLMIEANLIHGAWAAGVKRLLNFGSSCMYPRECPQPMAPAHLMTGPLEPTSGPYAMAKLAGWAMCDAYNRQYGTRFITAIPCTVYGPGDRADVETAHVLPALMRKCHDAKAQGERTVTLWGTGAARREFVYADDVAEACDVLLARYDGQEPINIGPGQACTVRELAELVADVVGFQGEIRWDHSKPDGAPEKRLDASAIHQLGWAARTPLRRGIERTYRWLLEHDGHPMGKVACASS